jgi:hypothetical protein
VYPESGKIVPSSIVRVACVPNTLCVAAYILLADAKLTGCHTGSLMIVQRAALRRVHMALRKRRINMLQRSAHGSDG